MVDSRKRDVGKRGRKKEAIRREQEVLWTRLTFATGRGTSASVHAAALRSTYCLDPRSSDLPSGL
jgi:hypothetical protein